MAVQSSSIVIPCCRFPLSCSLSPSPHRQQQFSLWACSPIPTHQLPAPLHTCEHKFQSRACRAEIRTASVFLTLSHLPQIGCFTLFQQPQRLPFHPNQFPHRRGGFPKFGTLSSASAPPPRGSGPVHFLSSFSLLFFHPTQLCRNLYSRFWCPRSSASFQPVS